MQKNISRWSPNAVEYFGLAGEYIYNASFVWESRIHPDDKDKYAEYLQVVYSGKKADPTFEYRAKNKNGEYVICAARGVVIKDYAGRPVFYACSIINKGIVDNSDPITLLPNQYEMLNYMRQLKASKTSYSILLINFIDFGDVNRRYGYMTGNNILRVTGKKILQEGKSQGRVFRGDGTTLAFISEMLSVDDIKKIYGRMREYTRESLLVSGNQIGAELAGGMIVCDNFEVDEHSIYTSAKYALDFSKTQKHGNLIIFHNDEMDNNRSSIELVNEVRKCVLNNFEGFYLEYQPIISAANAHLVGMEVLLRWKKEPYGVVSPAEFVPWLEQDPVFYLLGNWILENALRDALEIRKNNRDFYLSVNLAFMQLERSEFRTTLLEILRKTNYPATGLCLNMTASSRQLGMEHLKSQIEFIKSCGIKVGVDCVDFASLDIVRSFTVDLVSLVPSLTGPIADNLTAKYMIEAVTSFTHKLGIRTCFTGIEDEEQLRIARQYPVSDLMGYYFGRPCRIEDFKKLSFLSK